MKKELLRCILWTLKFPILLYKRFIWRIHQLRYWWKWDLLFYLYRKILPNERIEIKWSEDGFKYDLIINNKNEKSDFK